MPIYTPRGLKIRIDPLAAFAIMHRLEPQVSPFRILKTVEAVELTPAVLAYAAAALCATFAAEWQYVLMSTAAAGAVAGVMATVGLAFLPGILHASLAYSYINGFGIVLTTIAALLWWRSGVEAVAAYAVGRVISGAVNGIAHQRFAAKTRRQLKTALQASEDAFVAAVVFHSSRIGRQLTFDYDPARDKSDALRSLEHFAKDSPAAASKITFT